MILLYVCMWVDLQTQFSFLNFLHPSCKTLTIQYTRGSSPPPFLNKTKKQKNQPSQNSISDDFKHDYGYYRQGNSI